MLLDYMKFIGPPPRAMPAPRNTLDSAQSRYVKVFHKFFISYDSKYRVAADYPFTKRGISPEDEEEIYMEVSEIVLPVGVKLEPIR